MVKEYSYSAKLELIAITEDVTLHKPQILHLRLHCHYGDTLLRPLNEEVADAMSSGSRM
jgi:hypothetical protein